MAIKHRQLVKSKEGVDANDRSSNTSLLYLLTGSDVVDDMRTYLDDPVLVPEVLDGLVYKSLSRVQLGRRAWQWEAEYVDPDSANASDKLEDTSAEAVFSFDTTGATSIVFASKPDDVQTFVKVPYVATDYEGAINVDEQGTVKGVEQVIPALKLSYRKRLPRATITAAYVKSLARLTGTTNNATFKTEWEAGELLFLGATGQQGTKTDPEVTFHYAAAENVDDLTIGEIAAIAKQGHDYLWVKFERIEDTAAKTLAPRPRVVYVHRVYKSANWSAMGV